MVSERHVSGWMRCVRWRPQRPYAVTSSLPGRPLGAQLALMTPAQPGSINSPINCDPLRRVSATSGRQWAAVGGCGWLWVAVGGCGWLWVAVGGRKPTITGRSGW